MEFIGSILNIKASDFETFFQLLRSHISTYAAENNGFSNVPTESVFGIINSNGSVSLILSNPDDGSGSIDFLYQHKIDDFIIFTKVGDDLKLFWNHIEQDGECDFSPNGDVKTVFYKNRAKLRELQIHNPANLNQAYVDIVKSIDSKKSA